MVNPSRTLSVEVLRIYEIVAEYRNNAKANEDNDRQNRAVSLTIPVTVGTIIIIGLLVAAKQFLPPPTTWGDSTEQIRLTIQVMILFVYALGGGVILAQFFSMKSLYKDFTGQILSMVTDGAKLEANLFAALDPIMCRLNR